MQCNDIVYHIYKVLYTNNMKSIIQKMKMTTFYE